ncbi:Thioesterase/thiol ester dehydrase-isomerase [Hypoxylon sp. NC1633]|nr:Thioesterase/thiol ester dehydrase-isomerase [Hypoxylon sp. NC1633]
MADPIPLESLVGTATSPAFGNDAFKNKVLVRALSVGIQQYFNMIFQAVTAASATLSSHFSVIDEDLIYKVECVADGRTYATRIVRAEQRGKCVYVAVLSFQCDSVDPGSVLKYRVPMPDVDGLRSEDLNGEEFLKHMRAGHPSLAKAHAGEPFEWRPAAVEQGDDPSKYRARGFFRSRTQLPRDRTINLAALAYVSDKWFIGTALSANPKAVGERMRNLATAASLTHTLSFHDLDVRVDEWLVAERHTSWGAEGRRLVLDCTQEAVVWLKPSKL